MRIAAGTSEISVALGAAVDRRPDPVSNRAITCTQRRIMQPGAGVLLQHAVGGICGRVHQR